MNILDLLKGKKAKVMADAKVIVELEIKSVQENKHSEDMEPATAANDWWPKSRDWVTYDVVFTNGATKSYANISDIELL